MSRVLPRCAGWLASALILAMVVGCTAVPRGERRSAARPAAGPPAARSLASPDIRARSIQLYRGPVETALPILPLNRGEVLTLEFDLLGTNARTLNIQFDHVDLDGRVDVSNGSFFRAFNEDTIVDFYFSYRTDLPYQHYVYTFPNSRIGFQASGSYLVRVTDPDDTSVVLFERMFFVHEAAGSMAVDLQTELVPGRGIPLGLPRVTYLPPSSERGSSFDYRACAIFNGQVGWQKCNENVPISNGATFQFPSEIQTGLDPDEPLLYLDLRDLEDNRRIVGEDSEVRPPRYVLEPDPPARFPGPRAYLNGQTRIRDNSYLSGDPNTEGEYVTIRFQLTPPDGQPLRDPVYLIGSFSAWQIHPELVMEWQPDGSGYHLDVVLKQGEYEYKYVSADRSLSWHLADRARPERGLLTVMLFYRDPGFGYDRLLAVEPVEVVL